MRTVLICHHDDRSTREGLSRWLASFSDLVGIVEIHEGKDRAWKRLRAEWKRSGPLGLIDVVAFRLYYRLALAARDARIEEADLERLKRRYPPVPTDVPVLVTATPNSRETQRFLEDLAPDIALARCKFLLARRIFDVPKQGTFVMHPGICPEYRNSHGCFWALARDDLDNVGMTLLKIDAGVDTGPVYGYFRYPYDEVNESHIVIQSRVVLENLDAIAGTFDAIHRGEANTIDTTGRRSGTWGQPWLTRYLRWKARARARAKARVRSGAAR